MKYSIDHYMEITASSSTCMEGGYLFIGEKNSPDSSKTCLRKNPANSYATAFTRLIGCSLLRFRCSFKRRRSKQLSYEGN